MLVDVFTFLSKAVEGSAGIALGASLGWGVLSVILSPCHLATIPLIVGFISEQPNLTSRKAFTISALFGLGVLITIAAIGVVTAAMGRIMGEVGAWGNYVVAAVFIVVGLHLIGLIPLSFSGASSSGFSRRGLAAAFLLGLIYGVALGPCTFAFMAPVLAVSFKAASTNVVYSAALLALYGVGHCSVIVAAGTSTEAVQRYLSWNEKSHAVKNLKRVCGVLVILAAIHLIRIA